MKVVMVFGAFDGLHPGHLDFFKQARKYGDTLVVSVGLDANVYKIKGKKPLLTQDERLSLVRDSRLVDNAVLGETEDFNKHIKDYAPDVICLGYDQWAKEEDLKRDLDLAGLAKTEIVRLKPYEKNRAKSSILQTDSVDF